MGIFDNESNPPEHLLASLVTDLEQRFLPWRMSREKQLQELNYDYDDSEDLISDRSNTPGSPSDIRRRSRSRFRSNFIPTGHLHLVNRLQRARMHISVAELNGTDTTRASMTERLLHGAVNHQDYILAQRNQQGPWLHRLADFAALGKLAIFPWVRKDATGKLSIEWNILDPMGVLHDFTSTNRVFISQSELSLWEYQSLWQDALTDNTSEFLDGWAPNPKGLQNTELARERYFIVSDIWVEDGDTVYNAMLTASPTSKETEVAYIRKMAFTRLPQIIIPINGASSSYKRLSSTANPEHTYMRDHARPWFWPIISHVRHLNLARSLMIDGLEMQIRPPVTTRAGSDDIIWTIPEGALGPSATIPLTRERLIEFMNYQSHAIDAESTVIAGILDEINQQLPPEARGQIPSPSTSGYLFNQISEVVDQAIVHYDRGMTLATELTMMETLHQLEQIGGNTVISVAGRERSGDRQGFYYFEDFNISSIAKTPIVKVKYSMALPKDDLRTSQIFQLATETGMLDPVSARATIANDEHPHETQEKVDRAKVHDSQIFVDDAILDEYLASIAELEDQLSASTSIAKKRQLRIRIKAKKQRFEAFKNMLLGTGRDFQQTPGISAPPSSVQPPEARGIQSPDVMDAALGGGQQGGGLNVQ